jgi:hypothetical protein
VIKLSTTTSKKTGFALVIALSLMSFVLLLLLSITTLIQVESTAASTANDKLLAEQNALLGVYVALGELQRTAGPDQRVTANAEIFDTSPESLDASGVANPFLIGVFKSVEEGSETQPLESLRNWATNVGAADRVDWLASTSSEFLGGNVINDTPITINGGEQNVVSLARFTANDGDVVSVDVGKVAVELDGRNSKGKFAWWISDESVKHRINVTKPDTAPNGGTFDENLSLFLPYRSNPSIIDELSSFDAADAALKSKLQRVTDSSALKLVDPAWSDWLEVHSNDYTTNSFSLPVDVTQGRLKEDLTVYLETNSSPLEDSDFIVRGESNDGNYDPSQSAYVGPLQSFASSENYNRLQVPEFGLIKSWYETGMQMNGLESGQVSEPRPQLPDQSGLHPVIMRTALYFTPSFVPATQGTQNGINLAFLIYPKFVLWNPHNVPIAPGSYAIQVRAQTTLNVQYNGSGVFAARNLTQGFNYRGNIQPAGFGHLNFANDYLVRESDGFEYLTFVIDSQGFAPGETLLFTADIKHPNSEYVNTSVEDLRTVSLQSHNLLINENNSDEGFFYITSRRVLLPDPSTITAPTPANPLTNSSDELFASFHFRDTNASPPREPSLSTKLWLLSNSGPELLQFLDFTNGSNEATLDWEHINTEGWSSQRNPNERLHRFKGIGDSVSGLSLPEPAWGTGYFMMHTGGGGGGQSRILSRFAVASPEYVIDDPLVNNAGGLYRDAIPDINWFDGTGFPSEIYDFSPYGGTIDHGVLGGYGMYSINGSTPHSTVYPLYDYPREQTGLPSLGFLKNVNFAQTSFQSSYSFGNSNAHTHVRREARAEAHGSIDYYDLSHVLNESLVDRFFLSTVPQTESISIDGKLVLPNSRNRVVANKKGFPTDAELRNSEQAFKEAAAHIAIEGGFNVNSTSVNAWRLLLASLLGEKVTAADGLESHANNRAALSSRVYPLLAENPGDFSGPETWSALRSLSVAEIDALAVAIVEQVKRRGPFLSVADFVNRRLIPDSGDPDIDNLGLKGGLQAAIDAVSTTQNLINSNAYLNNVELPFSGGLTITNDRNQEHEIGMPNGEAGSRIFGAPGFLTQGDLFSALAPLITVRGDTFTIRSYGEVESLGGNGSPAVVRLEALVQRVSEPVASGDSLVKPEGKFGRSFKILSIKRVEADEI